MANNCYYEMKVVASNKEDIEKFIRAMNEEGEYEGRGVGRVFECTHDEILQRPDNTYECMLYGDCAWSITSAMVESLLHELPNPLNVITKDLGLTIEAYGSECGFAFQQHLIYDNGECLLDDEIEYWEIDICDGDEEEFKEDNGCGYDEYFAEEGMAKLIEDGKTWRDYEWDGYVHLGGYPEWNFEI